LAVSSLYWLSTSLFLIFGHLFSLSVDDLFWLFNLYSQQKGI
jgi:hypothetical protein